MDEYLVWLVFLALSVLSLTIIQLQAGRSRKLQDNCMKLQKNIQLWQDQLREKEDSIDHLQRGTAQLLKWKERSRELEDELKKAKQTRDYASGQRLQFLEDHLAMENNHSTVIFLSTNPSEEQYSIENQLRIMLERASFEIVIVSPWIKRHTWDQLNGPLRRFSRRGGRLRVFMRGTEYDYSMGFSDDLREQISLLGGELVPVAGLHAKIYMVDRREAIVASANLTKGGTEANLESGVWINDPSVLKDICSFVDGTLDHKVQSSFSSIACYRLAQ
jgi:phosphatidylserine/phosphatidylglycerophosphate/cardiolipin synthase-like enzyme